MLCCISLTSCAHDPVLEQGVSEEESAEETQELVQEESVVYPVVLSEEESKRFLDKYEGNWMVYEFPSVEEVYPGFSTYDVWPQTVDIYKYNEEYTISYDVTPSNFGHSYSIDEIVQENETTFRLNVSEKELNLDFDLPEWFDITYFYLIETGENNKIQFKSQIRENNNAYCFKNDGYKPYYEWLRSNGYYVTGDDPYNPIEGKLWPTGLDNERVSLYEAKQIMEDAGLVFTTDIPENEWNDPKPYSFSYIIDGKQYYEAPYFACKLGTEVFFYYY